MQWILIILLQQDDLKLSIFLRTVEEVYSFVRQDRVYMNIKKGSNHLSHTVLRINVCRVIIVIISVNLLKIIVYLFFMEKDFLFLIERKEKLKIPITCLIRLIVRDLLCIQIRMELFLLAVLMAWLYSRSNLYMLYLPRIF